MDIKELPIKFEQDSYVFMLMMKGDSSYIYILKNLKNLSVLSMRYLKE